MSTLYVIHRLAVALKTTMVELMADVEAAELPGEEPPPLPRGRPRKKLPAAGRKPAGPGGVAERRGG